MVSGTEQVLTLPEMENLVKKFDENARRCRETGDYLKKQTNGMFWQAPAADAFRQNMAHYQSTLARLEQEMLQLSKELNRRINVARADQSK